MGTTQATPSGSFQLAFSSLSRPYLTATASDPVAGTSEFSEVFNTGPERVFLPLVLKGN